MCIEPIVAVAAGGSAGVCLVWNGKRLMREGAQDSVGWPSASIQEVEDMHHYARLVQGAYEHSRDNLSERVPYISPEAVVEFSDRSEGTSEEAMCPPHFIFTDNHRKEVVLCIRGMRLYSATDYRTLLSNRRGVQPFLNGYVHRGIFWAAEWLCGKIKDLIKDLLAENTGYSLTLVGHSLGAGVAAMAALILSQSSLEIIGIPRDQIKCFAFAPPRIMSLNLAVDYGDVIRGIVLQDDFWPRVSTSMVAKIFISSLCGIQFVLFSRMVKDVFISDKRRLADSKRLYPPGYLYHILCKNVRSCSTSPYRVVAANPNGPRFEKLVLSFRAAADHRIRSYDMALSEALDRAYDNPELFQTPASSSFFEARLDSESDLEEDNVNREFFNEVFESLDMKRNSIDICRQRTISVSLEKSAGLEEELERKTEKRKYLLNGFL